ncbi:MAG: NAD-dependent epimerase/dehydratase family protein [Frankia sp.]
MRVLVAGAAGAIGERLVPRLIAEGHEVVATTRSAAKIERLRGMGAEPVVMDGLDAVAVGEVVAKAHPEVVIHQMTALTGAGNLRRFDHEFAATNDLRTRGTDNLLAAAVGAGVRRIVVASFTGWPNIRVGGPVKTEKDPLDPRPPAAQHRSLAAIAHLEKVVPAAREIEGLVLRYGIFYGPGSSNELFTRVRKRALPLVGDSGGVWSFIHVDDAAAATVAALRNGTPGGIYNIVDDDPAPLSEWLPFLAEAVGAKPPRRVPVWLARIVGGEVAVSMTTRIRGSSNARARDELGWTPQRASWRQGFPETERTNRAAPGGTAAAKDAEQR